MTHRQYLGWKEWLRDEWNKPSRNDHYLMQVALRIIQKFNPEASSLPLDSMKIPFGFLEEQSKVEKKPKEAPKSDKWMKGRTPPPIMTKELIEEVNLKLAKSRWGKLAGN